MSRRRLLPLLDAAALLVFVAIGIAQHRGDAIVPTFLRTALPLVVAWFAVAAVAGTYRRPTLRTMLVTWIVAVPAGLLLRTAWVGSPHGSEIAVFVGVGLAFTLLFLLLGRAAAHALGNRRAPATSGVVR
jgi:hypothetical protein